MARIIGTMGVLALAASTATATVELWNNGGMVTHPGAGPGGFDVSMASVNPNTAGSNARNVPPDPHFRVADDFTLNTNCIVETICVFAYETNQNTPTWTGANMNIWDGRPGDGGSSIIASTSTVSVVRTQIYRTFNGVTNNTARLINQITFDFGALALGSGTYWIDWQVVGGGSGWANYVMEANPADPNNPITVAGNARHLTAAGWIDMLGGVPLVPELPFVVKGIPSPGSLAVLGLAGLVASRRRR